MCMRLCVKERKYTEDGVKGGVAACLKELDVEANLPARVCLGPRGTDLEDESRRLHSQNVCLNLAFLTLPFLYSSTF